MIHAVDYVLLGSVGVVVSTLVILVLFLARYRSLVTEANESTRLAKDVWDSMNSRFTVIDARIIDLMARTEVLAAKSVAGQEPSATAATPSRPTLGGPLKPTPTATQAPKVVTPPPTSVSPPSEGTETEARVLQLLLDGPKTSSQIKEGVGKSREHTARLMKFLFDKGLVVRNSRNKPYVYELTDSGKSYLSTWSAGK